MTNRGAPKRKNALVLLVERGLSKGCGEGERLTALTLVRQLGRSYVRGIVISMGGRVGNEARPRSIGSETLQAWLCLDGMAISCCKSV